MRPVDSNTLAALHGSRTGDRVTAWAWRGGALAWPEPLTLSAWTATWDTARNAQGFTATIVDRSGRLAPWLLGDPLGVGGSQLQVLYTVGGAATLNLGWYRITRSQPTERWRGYAIRQDGTVTPGAAVPAGTLLTVQPEGAAIQVDAADRAQLASGYRFIAPESPGSGATVLGEIRRILADIMPVTVNAAITDTGLNSTLVHQQQDDRWSAVQSLAARLGAAARVTGDGQCEVYPLAMDPVDSLYGGPGGVLATVDKTQDVQGIYNGFVVDGTATGANGQSVPIRGMAFIDSGDLRWGGPHGRVPTFYSSTMITTQAQADAYAAQMRDTQLAGLTTDLIVTCAAMPHLELGDWVTVAAPRLDGMATPLKGRIVAMGLKGAGTTVDRMTLTVRCDHAAVYAALTGPSATSIAGPVLTGQHTAAALYPSTTLHPSTALYPEG